MKAQTLAMVRKTLHWSLAEVGEHTNYSKSYVRDLEKGIAPIQEEFKKRLIDAINLHIKDAEKIIQKIS